MSISFKKIIDFPNWQIYSVLDKSIKLPKTFRYVYWSSYIDKVLVVDKDDFEFDLVFEGKGFIFCRPSAQVPKIQVSKESPMKSSVLFSANLNKYILESEPSEAILNFRPSMNAHPIFNMNIVVRYDNEEKLKETNPKKLIKEIIESQTNKNPKDWYNNILKNCPDIHYQDVIRSSDFNKQVTAPKFIIEYDFKSKNDLDLLSIVEEKFIDLKSKIKIYEDISGKYKFARNFCQKNKIPFKDGIINKIKFIEMKYSDFLKVEGLNPTIGHLLD